MQIKYLKNIAVIESGKSFRRKPEFTSEVGCLLIQMKDLSPDGIEKGLNSISMEEVGDSRLLGVGDLLFVAKGNVNYAVVYHQDKPAVAMSFFFVIRVDKRYVDPDFLAWYINSSGAQQYFERHRAGASVGNIRISVLEGLEVVLPDLETQKKIARLSQLAMEERKLNNAYMQSRQIFINESISQLIKS